MSLFNMLRPKFHESTNVHKLKHVLKLQQLYAGAVKA